HVDTDRAWVNQGEEPGGAGRGRFANIAGHRGDDRVEGRDQSVVVQVDLSLLDAQLSLTDRLLLERDITGLRVARLRRKRCLRRGDAAHGCLEVSLRRASLELRELGMRCL